MTQRNGSISELESLEVIDRLSRRYREAYGSDPYNVSHWDPSPQFQSDLVGYLNIPPHNQLIDYVFSYTLAVREQLLESLGFDPTQKGCLVTPSRSVSILCIVNWLKNMGIEKFSALCPVYFTLAHNCRRVKISLDKTFLVRRHMNYQIPSNLMEARTGPEVLWITNPVYCTGVHMSDDDLEPIKELLERGRGFNSRHPDTVERSKIASDGIVWGNFLFIIVKGWAKGQGVVHPAVPPVASNEYHSVPCQDRTP